MTHYKTSLDINFGQVGYRSDNSEDFCVTLVTEELSRLIKSADKAHRLYELMLITRPGDIWDYVSVVVNAGPKSVLHRVSKYFNDATTNCFGKKAPFELVTTPTKPIPFNKFDSFFYWSYDDTDPAAQAWLDHRDSSALANFAKQLFGMVVNAQNRLEFQSPLAKHIKSSFDTGAHPYHQLSRAKAIEACNPYFLPKPLHSAGFYKKLKELLQVSGITSVAFRGGRDYETLLILATEQRERITATGLCAAKSLLISTTNNGRFDNDNWGSRIRYYDEGMGPGDLWIDEEEGNYNYLLTEGWRSAGLGLLSPVDQGEIVGHTKEIGDGWFYYENAEAFNRRQVFHTLEYFSQIKHTFVFDFGNDVSIVNHDKTIVAIGQCIADDVRQLIATTVAAWQKNGGDVLLLIEGNIDRFNEAGCKKAVPIRTISTAETNDKAMQTLMWKLQQLIDKTMPWIDVMLTVGAPDWVCKQLSETANKRESPWQVWVAATENTPHLKPNHVLSNDLLTTLSSAKKLAQQATQ